MEDNFEKDSLQSELRPKKTKRNLITALLILFAVFVVFIFFRFDDVGNFIYKIGDILTPIFFGIAIAYMLNPVVIFVERLYELAAKKIFHIKGEKYKGRANTFAIVLSVVLLCGIIYILLYAVLPQLYQTFVTLIDYIPSNFDKISEWFENLRIKEPGILGEVGLDMDTVLQNVETWLTDNLVTFANELLKYITSGVKSVISFIANLIIGICVAVYLMKEKNTIFAHMKKIVTASFKPDKTKLIMETSAHAKTIFNGYIYGNIVGCIIVFIATFAFMLITNMPYAMLISTLVCVTNFIPFFGPFIGAIPSILILLLHDPMMALSFTIFTLILQQVEGHFLTPLIISDTTGVSPFWVTAALLVGAGFFGLLGLILSVPVFSVIYYIVKLAVEDKLAKKALPVSTESYVTDNDFGKGFSLKIKKEKKKK